MTRLLLLGGYDRFRCQYGLREPWIGIKYLYQNEGKVQPSGGKGYAFWHCSYLPYQLIFYIVAWRHHY